MSWILLHEEAPARSLKISLIRRNWKFFKLHLNPSLGNYTDCNLIDWQKNLFMFQILLFGWKDFSVFIHFIWQHVCFFQSRRDVLREDVSIHRTNLKFCGPKFVFSATFIFCSPICSNDCGVVFLWKYILVFEKWLFSFDRSNMQIFTVNITRVVWPHVTNIVDLRYFCEHNPLFYHLNLIPCCYWSWQRNIYFLVNIFVRHTFPMSKSSFKTKTVLHEVTQLG